MNYWRTAYDSFERVIWARFARTGRRPSPSEFVFAMPRTRYRSLIIAISKGPDDRYGSEAAREFLANVNAKIAGVPVVIDESIPHDEVCLRYAATCF